MHDASCFFTLTYDDENVPADYSVKLSDWQKFIRRTRKRIGLKGLRFAGGGEYGELGLRPHYHGLFSITTFRTSAICRSATGMSFTLRSCCASCGRMDPASLVR